MSHRFCKNDEESCDQVCVKKCPIGPKGPKGATGATGPTCPAGTNCFLGKYVRDTPTLETEPIFVPIPNGAKKVIINAVGGGGAGAAASGMTERGSGGGGAGAGVNGLILPLVSAQSGTLKVVVGQGGKLASQSGTSSIISGFYAPDYDANFKLELTGGLGGTSSGRDIGGKGGDSGQVILNGVTIIGPVSGGIGGALNTSGNKGADCALNGMFTSGGAGGGGSGRNPSNNLIYGGDGGNCLFPGGKGGSFDGSPVARPGAGGGSNFAKGGDGDGGNPPVVTEAGTFGSGGGGSLVSILTGVGGDGYVELEFLC